MGRTQFGAPGNAGDNSVHKISHEPWNVSRPPAIDFPPPSDATQALVEVQPNRRRTPAEIAKLLDPTTAAEVVSMDQRAAPAAVAAATVEVVQVPEAPAA